MMSLHENKSDGAAAELVAYVAAGLPDVARFVLLVQIPNPTMAGQGAIVCVGNVAQPVPLVSAWLRLVTEQTLPGGHAKDSVPG